MSQHADLGFDPNQLKWRRPSRSNGANTGSVLVAQTPDGQIAMCDSARPDDIIVCRPLDLACFVAAAKAGEYRDIAPESLIG